MVRQKAASLIVGEELSQIRKLICDSSCFFNEKKVYSEKEIKPQAVEPPQKSRCDLVVLKYC